MDRQNVIYLYNEVLLSGKKEQTTDICSDSDKSQKHYA